MFRKHPLFSTDERAIQIIAYYDEIELCNPLGSNTKVHKLGCVFFTLGNFHPSYRSWLKSIFLIAVASAPTIKLHGIDKFLRPFVDDIKRLSSNGLHCVSLNGERRHFQLGLLAFLADNLAAHAVGGFKESMSFAYRICRSCTATTEEAQKYFEESHFELRTADIHEQQCQLLEGPLAIHHYLLMCLYFCTYMQDPIQIRVGKAHYVTRFSGSKRQKVLKSDFFYYIPVENTLKQLLQQPDILAEVDHFHGSRDGILRDM